MGTVDIHHLDSLILVAGISGAGRSRGVDVISDYGFFNLENLPVSLLEDFVAHSRSNPSKYRRTVLLADIDSPETLHQFLSFVDKLDPQTNKAHLIFFDCADDVLLRRYSETRRPHPGFDPLTDKTLVDAVRRERNRLASFRERAHLVVDTSHFTIHDLKRELHGFCDSLSLEYSGALRVNVMSFGFKFGVPPECDLAIDVRFLPNPYFVNHLREKDGREKDVAEYVLDSPECQEFLHRYTSLLEFLLPKYAFEGKHYLSIGVGCTGGQHRSVAVAEELARRLPHTGYRITVKHRDLKSDGT